MRAAAWAQLEQALSRWTQAGRVADFWLRDDDAVEPSPALERLLELGDRPLDLPLALGSDTQANMRRNILGIRAQHALERLLRAVELPVRQVGLAQDAIGLEIIGVLIEDMLG